MKAINQKAQKVMDQLTEGMAAVCDHRWFDNAEGVFMAAVVEYINDTKSGPVFSVAHYYEQNGDLCRDPEMTFLRGFDGKYYPLSFQQDGIGLYQESVIFGDDGNPEKFSPRLQKDHAVFAGDWFSNIKYQQKL